MKTGFKQESNQLKRSPASIHKDKHSPAPGLVDNRNASAVQRRLKEGIDNSPVMTLQRQQLEHSFGHPIQKVAEDEEELLQGKFEAVQRQPEEEELMQGKFGTVQRFEDEEELLQGKFETVQRQGDLEEEELMQAKFGTAQRVEEEEELLQGKFEPVQRQSLEEEEEPLQGKYSAGTSPTQLQEETTRTHNQTGMPDQLKAGVESLSGLDMSDVRVHYNSSKPTQLNALAYAQGNDIHLGAGQEQHLPHEAWHTVQQRQGRVKPTMQMAGVKVNDDVGLEKEADVMGERALQAKLGTGGGGNKGTDPILLLPLQGMIDKSGGLVVQRSPKYDALVYKVNNHDSATQQNRGTVIQRGAKYNALYKKAKNPANVTDTEIKEATLEVLQEMFSAKAYKDSEGAAVQPPTPELDDDYGAVPGLLFLPNKAEVCSDIRNGVFKMALGHEMGHYVRTIDNKSEGASFPNVEDVIADINWTELAVNYPPPTYNMDSWKEEIRADLKGIKLHFNKDGKVPSKSKISAYGAMLGNVVDNAHPPAAIRMQAMRAYVREIKPSRCCFITTACVQSKGLPDDCDELTVLRDFRDNYLAQKENGPALIEIYYKNSPAIVEAIDDSQDPDEIYDELFKVIKSCVRAIKDGDNEYAFNTYCDMVINLKRNYIPEKEWLNPDDSVIETSLMQIMHPYKVKEERPESG